MYNESDFLSTRPFNLQAPRLRSVLMWVCSCLAWSSDELLRQAGVNTGPVPWHIRRRSYLQLTASLKAPGRHEHVACHAGLERTTPVKVRRVAHTLFNSTC